MANEESPPQESLTEISPCRLKQLLKRSQIDFEIDFFEQVLSRNPNYIEALRVLGDLLAQKGCHRRALQIDQRLVQLQPQDPVVAYNLACSHAVLNQPVEAVQALQLAFHHGYSDIEFLLNDADLKSLHKDEGFRKLLVGLLNAESRSQHRLV